MPAISGSQQALMYSYSGVLRSGAGRSGYFPVPVVMSFSVGGTIVTTKGVKTSMRIVDELNDAPNTCDLTVRGSSSFTPTRGQELVIGVGNLTNRLFAGHITKVTRAQPRRNQKKPRFDLQAIDYSWQLDWKRVVGKAWGQAGPAAIVAELLTSYAPGFTLRAEGGLALVDFQSNHDERVSEAISRLVGMIGGFWYVDYDRCVHIYVNPEPDGNAVSLTSANTGFWNFTYEQDITQTRTRTRATGGSTTATAITSAGSSSVAVADTSGFGSSGGSALAGANQFTYTGKSTASGPGSLTGASAITSDIALGDSVRVLAIASDAAAAAVVAGLVGTGDGYLEHGIDDGQLGDAAARLAAAADVAQHSTSDERVTYTTRDLFTRSGKVITVSLTNSDTGQAISVTVRIQRVVISEVELSRRRNPVREVEAGNTRRDVMVALGGLLE